MRFLRNPSTKPRLNSRNELRKAARDKFKQFQGGTLHNLQTQFDKTDTPQLLSKLGCTLDLNQFNN